jgi:hemerythrin
MEVEWTYDLATGSDEIDRQHKELFKRINAFHEACRQGKGRGDVREVLRFLDDYVAKHFSEEEKYMLKYDYPDYEKHKAQHLEYIRTIAELQSQLEREEPGDYLLIKTNRVIAEWLINHIRRVDKSLGAFLKRKV